MSKPHDMPQLERVGRGQRQSRETTIGLELNLDGTGQIEVDTGLGFFNHMLTLIFFWAGMDLKLICKGDLDVDAHHTMEDTGLVLGTAFREALGSGQGIERTGFGRVPMDEALAEVTLDLSGRPWIEWRGEELLPPVIAHDEKDVWREFYKAFASNARCNLHISFLYGKNGHHLLESVAKGLGVALRNATRRTGYGVRSTKGGID